MALLTEEIIEETHTTLTIRFTDTSQTRYLEKQFNKIEGLTTEQLVQRAHRRATLEYLQRPFRFKRIESVQQES